MQTFLPYDSFPKCAEVLDNRRLCKQIVEVEQICRALNDPDNGWHNHPAVKMWCGYYANLVAYGCAMYREWQIRYMRGDRGGKREHKSGEQLKARFVDLAEWIDDDYSPPPWLGDARLHSSHRSCLLAKNFDHYCRFDWEERPTPPVDGKWPYWWPEECDEKDND